MNLFYKLRLIKFHVMTFFLFNCHCGNDFSRFLILMFGRYVLYWRCQNKFMFWLLWMQMWSKARAHPFPSSFLLFRLYAQVQGFETSLFCSCNYLCSRTFFAFYLHWSFTHLGFLYRLISLGVPFLYLFTKLVKLILP